MVVADRSIIRPVIGCREPFLALLSMQLKTEAIMTIRASGTFQVKIVPLALDDKAADATLGRLSIDKTFLGDLDATSKGEMLSAGTAVKGSAGYVAIERVSGALNGRAGTFVLQHSGTMNRGEPQLTVTIVPDSGTGQLAGLAGRMTIKIEAKAHVYELEYTLPETS
jgi:Protein of unknown function (DUF3224)